MGTPSFGYCTYNISLFRIYVNFVHEKRKHLSLNLLNLEQCVQNNVHRSVVSDLTDIKFLVHASGDKKKVPYLVDCNLYGDVVTE